MSLSGTFSIAFDHSLWNGWNVCQAGDANVRMHSAAVDMLLHLADIKDTGLNTLTHYFTRPVKSQTAWRQVLGRLQLIRALLDKLEMNKNNTSGFEIDAVMAFLSSAFTSANAEVRGAAVKLAVQVRFRPNSSQPAVIIMSGSYSHWLPVLNTICSCAKSKWFKVSGEVLALRACRLNSQHG
jgi:hypothetical protein